MFSFLSERTIVCCPAGAAANCPSRLPTGRVSPQVWRQRARLTIKILRGDNPAIASAAARLRAYAAQVEPLRRLRNGGSQIVRRTCKTAVRTETLKIPRTFGATRGFSKGGG